MVGNTAGDIGEPGLRIMGVPEAPEGTEISRIDVVVRLADS